MIQFPIHLRPLINKLTLVQIPLHDINHSPLFILVSFTRPPFFLILKLSAKVADSRINHDSFEVVPADDRIPRPRVFVHDTFFGGQEDDIGCIVADGFPGFSWTVVCDVLRGKPSMYKDTMYGSWQNDIVRPGISVWEAPNNWKFITVSVNSTTR